MTSFDDIRPEPKKTQSRWRTPFRWLRRKLPRGLYARTLMIIVLPMIILQAVVAYVFMERHWRLVTGRLSTSVTREIAATIDLIDAYPERSDFAEVARIVRKRMELHISIEKGDTLPIPLPPPLFSILDTILGEEIKANIARPYWINTYGMERTVEIRILLEDDRILITNDKDFGEKAYRERRPHWGIVLLRLEDERPASKIEMVRRLLRDYGDRLRGNFVVVTEEHVRIAAAPPPA